MESVSKADFFLVNTNPVSGHKAAHDQRKGWAYPQRYFADSADETLQTLFDVSDEIGQSPAQVALRWVLEQRAMTSVIVGARHTEHLRDNLGAAGWRLEGDALQKLNEVSYLPDRYPEAMEKNMHERPGECR